jgi:hypothetical protein
MLRDGVVKGLDMAVTRTNRHQLKVAVEAMPLVLLDSVDS